MQRHLDGDLNSEEQKRLSEHLDACGDCTDMMERLQRVDQDLASLPKVTPAYSLVDAILPRLAQIDAASESTSAQELPPRVSADRSRRPWYARGAFARYGGLAAAAAVLGVLVVNGLTDSFKDNANTAQESAASGAGAAEARLMTTMEAPMEMSAADASAKDHAAPAAETPTSEEPTPATEPIDPNASVSSPPQSNAGGPKNDGNGDVGIAEVPQQTPKAPSSEPQPAGGEAQGFEGGGAQGLTGGGSGETEGTANVAETPTDVAEAPPTSGEGSNYGITADPALEDGIHDKGAIREKAPPALLSEDGAYSATVERKADGTQFIVVNELEGDADYASAYEWAAETKLELVGWEGATLTYTAIAPEGGVRTLRIDAASATETEIVE
jgi:anti-sigma factor RsiW